MPSHVHCLGSKSGGQSQGCGGGHVLPSHVAPSQVMGLRNWSGDKGQVIAIRWKNDWGML